MNIVNIIRDLFHEPYFACLLAMLACGCFYYLSGRKIAMRRIVWVIYYAIFVFALGTFIGSAVYRIYHPQVYDFTAFYLWGKVAASGHNFYLPENLQHAYGSMNLPLNDMGGFVPEIVDTGFFYPPPTILLFIPLGFLSFKTALVIWTVFNSIFVVGCIHLIYQMFLKPFKSIGLLLVCILLFIFLPSISTVNFSQTNFIVLFLLLLTKKYADSKLSGVFLALAFLVKPFMIIFGLYFLLRKQWKQIIYFIGVTVVLVGITFALFGAGPFISYIYDNPSHRMPNEMFSESVNQSLHAVLLRNGIITLENPIVYIYILGGMLLVSAGLIYYLLRKKLFDHILVVLLLIALLLYPGTLSYYGVVMLFIIFQFFNENRPLGFSPAFSIPIIGVFYFLSVTSIFSAICFLLVIMILKSGKSSMSIQPLRRV